MSFLRTLLMFVFVFSLVGISGSYAGKIKNCSNCGGKEHSNSYAFNENDNPITSYKMYQNYLWGYNNFKLFVKIV